MIKFRTPNKKNGRILQCEITTRCDKDCFNCTRALAQVRKPDMTPEQFEQAILASKDWIIRERGVFALFGGNPLVSKHFGEICDILAFYLPEENRGLWTNNFLNKGDIVKRTFTKNSTFNFNVHQDKKAADGIRDIFPWATIHGEDAPSMHASIFVAAQDFLPEKELWEAVEKCSYDIEWSAIIIQEAPDWSRLGGYSCEIAATHARTNGKALGVEIKPGWLDLMEDSFRHQYDFACRRCSGCLNLHGTQDLGGSGADQFSKTNKNVQEMTISKSRKTEMLESLPVLGGPPIDYLKLWS